MPTPMQAMHARWKREREAKKAAKPSTGTSSYGPANADPGTAAEPNPTGEEDDS